MTQLPFAAPLLLLPPPPPPPLLAAAAAHALRNINEQHMERVVEGGQQFNYATARPVIKQLRDQAIATVCQSHALLVNPCLRTNKSCHSTPNRLRGGYTTTLVIRMMQLRPSRRMEFT